MKKIQSTGADQDMSDDSIKKQVTQALLNILYA